MKTASIRLKRRFFNSIPTAEIEAIKSGLHSNPFAVPFGVHQTLALLSPAVYPAPKK